MKVRCLRLVDTSGRRQRRSPWLTIGKVYHVLALHEDGGGRWLLRILADEPNGPALFPLEDFEVVTPDVPPSWIAMWPKDSKFELTPKAWGSPQFWNRFYDRDPEAVATFEAEARKIIEADQ